MKKSRGRLAVPMTAFTRQRLEHAAFQNLQTVTQEAADRLADSFSAEIPKLTMYAAGVSDVGREPDYFVGFLIMTAVAIVTSSAAFYMAAACQ